MFGNMQEDMETPISPAKWLTSQEEWISEEELYTEGSSDEDDMALRIKRREQREGKREKPIGTVPQVNPNKQNLAPEEKKKASFDEHLNISASDEEQIDDDAIKWRPTQGSFKSQPPSSEDKVSVNSGDEDAAAAPEAGRPALSLSEAYSNMHKLDALLRDSDRRLKEAQAETLRAQMATRSQLRQLRERAGSHQVVMARNWDAFMQLCPAVGPLEPGADDGHLQGARRGEAGAGDQGYSVLPRISGADSDQDSEDSESSRSTLAITDEEKLKLAALLRDLDQDADGDADAGSAAGSRGTSATARTGFRLDAEARRSLENIDGKLQELVPEAAQVAAGVAAGAGLGLGVGLGVARGATRQQRLEDIDRCLQALAASALEDVDPVGEDEVRVLLQEARGAKGGGSEAGPRGQGQGAAQGAGGDEAVLVDPALIDVLLEQARKELPRFRYRHHEGADVNDTLGRPGRQQHLGSR